MIILVVWYSFYWKHHCTDEFQLLCTYTWAKKPCFINECNLSQGCTLSWIQRLSLHPSVFLTPPSPSPTKGRTLPPHLHTMAVEPCPLTLGLPCPWPALMSSSVEGSITGRRMSATALSTGSVRTLHGLLGLGWCQLFHCLQKPTSLVSTTVLVLEDSRM